MTLAAAPIFLISFIVLYFRYIKPKMHAAEANAMQGKLLDFDHQLMYQDRKDS